MTAAVCLGAALTAAGLVLALASPASSPARPAQCPALIRQLTAYARTIGKEGRSPFPVAEMATTSAFTLQLRRDAGSPAVPQPLWQAEDALAGALQSVSLPAVTAATERIRDICG